jgi:hypothetical protein
MQPSVLPFPLEFSYFFGHAAAFALFVLIPHALLPWPRAQALWLRLRLKTRFGDVVKGRNLAAVRTGAGDLEGKEHGK